jgi:hypothetical protein
MDLAGSRTRIVGNIWSKLKSKITIGNAMRTTTGWPLRDFSTDDLDSMMLPTDLSPLVAS